MKRRKRIIAIGAAITLLAIILAALTIIAGGESYEATMARWEAAGGARSLAEMKPEPIPADENAATFYRQAFAIINTIPQDALDTLRERGLDADEQLAGLALVPDDLFDHALAAAQRERCDWESKLYEEGMPALLPHLSDAGTLARILGLDMLRLARQGDDGAAIERLEAMMRLADHVMADPIIIGQLISVSVEHLAMERFREAYRDHATLPPNVRDHFERRPASEQLRETLLGEGMLAAHWIVELGASPLPHSLRKREAQISLSLILKVIDELDKPWPEQNIEAIENEIPFWAVGLSMVVPSYHRMIRNTMLGERHLLAMQAAIDLRSYRDEHGEYPHPDEWQMPIDPMTGEPIGYERTDEGMTISAPAIGREQPLYWEWP